MKRFLATLFLLLFAATGMVGCKNVCQKSAQHYLDCWTAHCEGNTEDTRCETRPTSAMATAMLEAESCPIEERAQTVLDATCEEITGEDGPGF